MQRLIYVLIFTLGLVGTNQAASWADGLFQERVKDFGTVPRGPSLQCSFPLTNFSSRTVRIKSMRVSCGCVTAHALQKTLRPGEATTIVATMDTTRFEGIKNVTIYVKFDRPRREEVRLWVRANSRHDVAVVPETLTFGQVKRGSNPTASTKISFLGDPPGRIKPLDPSIHPGESLRKMIPADRREP